MRSDDVKQPEGFNWVDLPLSGDKVKLLEIYQHFKLKLSLQNAIENRRQASAVCVQDNAIVIFCRYLFLDSNLMVNNDCLTLLLTSAQLTTLRHTQDRIWDQLRSSIQFLPATKERPGKVLALVLQKAFASTGTVLNSLDDSLSSLQSAYEEEGQLPSDKTLLQLRSTLGETSATASGLKELLDQLPVSLGLTPAGPLKAEYNLLQLTLNNLKLLLTSTASSLTALERLRRNQLLERTNTNQRQLFTLCSILLPLIFIAALYGMRFENMQELSSQWGYPLCLCVMALVALAAWWHSKK